MPAETPVNPIALAVEHLRQSLANSAAVRAWLGVATSALALARIYRAALPPPASNAAAYTAAEIAAYRPFIIVSTLEGFASTYDAARGYRRSGALGLELEQTIESAIAADPGEIVTRFENDLGAIIADLETNSATAGYLDVRSVTLDEVIYLADPDKVEQEGDWARAHLRVEWEGL